ncbi:MAG TPA: M20/M25/M40 family metallo-hydrolase [Acidobacteriaceae bacterium]|nr:M20/M25/M40 family metallo-hydrolase [Acidobacteriaceae bacterium]
MSFVRRSSAVSACAAILTLCCSAPAQKRKTAAPEAAEKSVPSYYGPQPAAEDIDLNMYARIREEGFQHSKVMQFGDALANGIGPRLTGSPNMEKANEWTRDTLTAIGLSNAHLEDWGDFGMGWQQINTWARMVSPDPEPLWMQAAPWSPATNGAVTGEIAYIPLQEASDLDKWKGKLKGKIVLLGAMRPTPDITEPLFHRYTDEELKDMEMMEQPRARAAGQPVQTLEQRMAERMRAMRLRQQALKMFTDEGVIAIITPTRDAADGGGTGIIFDDNGANLARDAQKPDNAVKIPNAVMMIEHYNRLAHLAEAHVPVTLEVNIETKFSGQHEHGFDTVAEIPGTDPKLKDQVVMVGGHLDSWISGTGATDNGAGSIVAMEAVRILKALDVHPRRTIRIALWSGEEEGLYGSQGYVKQHFGTFAPPNPPDPPGTPSFLGHHGALTTTKEWETLDAYYNLDNGTGKVRGVYTQQNFPIGPIFAQWIAPLKDLGVTTISYRNTGGTDHLSFDAVGLPGFQFIQDPMDYETRTHHSDMDTFDRLHQADLEQAAIVEAIFLWNTSQREAMMPRKPFPHPEREHELSQPIPNIYPNAQVPPPDNGKPAPPQHSQP